MAEETFGWQVYKEFPDCIRICDTQDLRSLRKFRQDLVQKKNMNNLHDLAKLTPELGQNDENLIFRELTSLHRCDLNLIVSSFEISLLREKYHFPSDKLCISPFYYDVNPNPVKTWEKRKNFFMIGNFNHEPNLDAVKWMKGEIWPRIHARLPDTKLDIFGSLVKREHMALSDSASGFRVKGMLHDLSDLQKYRCQLAPLRFGGGIKGKISDAWYYGTPSISTFIGTEGMKTGDEWGIWIVYLLLGWI